MLRRRLSSFVVFGLAIGLFAPGISAFVELKKKRSTVLSEMLYETDCILENIQAPKWPEDIVGKNDTELVDRGRLL